MLKFKNSEGDIINIYQAVDDMVATHWDDAGKIEKLDLSLDRLIDGFARLLETLIKLDIVDKELGEKKLLTNKDVLFILNREE